MGYVASMGPQHFSRGIIPAVHPEGGLEIASMGPQHFSRGIAPVPDWTETIHLLQWGRSISAAELFEACFGRYRIHRLQWGRSISAAELGRSRCHMCGISLLQWGRSISAAEFGRSQGGSTTIVLLQWGRSISAAELYVSVRYLSADEVLQWGRSISAAEFGRSASHPGMRCCFNGAAAFQPRNYRQDRRPTGGHQRASMGPQHFSRGISHTGWTCRTCRSLQWGRSISAAEFRPATGAPIPRVRFNGAAAFQPRNCAGGLAYDPSDKLLQWGRSISAAEFLLVRSITHEGFRNSPTTANALSFPLLFKSMRSCCSSYYTNSLRAAHYRNRGTAPLAPFRLQLQPPSRPSGGRPS